MGEGRLDLAAIERSLLAVQRDFERINGTLDVHRDPLSDQVLEYLLAGYERVSDLLGAGIDPFAVGGSRYLLELNHLVLCGKDALGCRDSAGFLKETEAHFYNDTSPGSARALVEHMALHKGESSWARAARAYIHVLSQPQLYFEGNHRTGALIMSLILGQAGKPPFVLTVANAKAYFDPSSLVKASKKNGLRMLIEIPKLRKRLASLLKETTDPCYLLDENARVRAPRRAAS